MIADKSKIATICCTDLEMTTTIRRIDGDSSVFSPFKTSLAFFSEN
jgi:hypothetical protein